MYLTVQLNSEERPIDWSFFDKNRFCHAFYPRSDKMLCGLRPKTAMLNPVPYSVIKADFDYIDDLPDKGANRLGKLGYVTDFFCMKCLKKANDENLLPDFIKEVYMEI